MTSYRITHLLGAIDTSEAPPAIVKAVFPAFDGEPCKASRDEIVVTFASPQTPTDNLGPLVKVEEVVA